MSFRFVPVALLGGALLCGCAPVDPGMGEAAKYNAYVQTVNPEPVYAAAGAQPGASGDLGAAASQRYRTDAVKKPVIQSSATSGSSGSGNGGSGSK